MATVTAIEAPAERFLFSDIGWDGYLTISGLIGDRPVRSSYSKGTLELMSPSFGHERFGRALARLVDFVSTMLEIPTVAGGSTTFRREDLDRGLEPDACYYFENAGRLSDPRRVDLSIDPPPDLAIEVEVSRTVLDRLGIYAALGVPEVWRFDGEALTVLRLDPQGVYATSPTSGALPFLPIAEVERLLIASETSDDTRWNRAVMRWIEGEVAPLHRAWQGDRGRA